MDGVWDDGSICSGLGCERVGAVQKTFFLAGWRL